MLRILTLCLLLILPNVAFADRASADACALSLSADAKKVYQITLPLITKTTNIRRITRRQAAILVREGKISSANPSQMALDARVCLRLARPPRD